MHRQFHEQEHYLRANSSVFRRSGYSTCAKSTTKKAFHGEATAGQRWTDIGINERTTSTPELTSKLSVFSLQPKDTCGQIFHFTFRGTLLDKTAPVNKLAC